MKHRPVTYRDCKYNSSKTASFVGYCKLPKYKSEKFERFVLCCKLPCNDFELRFDEE